MDVVGKLSLPSIAAVCLRVCSKALLQRRGVLVNMTADENTLRLATGVW